MSAPPYMKLYWGDYLKATRHLTRDQHGAYFLLIAEAWRLGGALPDDDAMLAAWALCTPSEWAGVKPVVMAFFALRRGKWVHDRVREELAHYGDVSRKRKRAGQTGGLASHGKPTANRPANAPQLPTKPEPEPEPERSSAVVVAREGADDWPEGDARTWAGLLVERVNTAALDPSRAPGLVTSAGKLLAWRRAGASWEADVLPVVDAWAMRAREPVKSWGYFEAAVLQAMADNQRPLEIPEAGQPRRNGRNGHDEPSEFSKNLARSFVGSEIAADAWRRRQRDE